MLAVVAVVVGGISAQRIGRRTVSSTPSGSAPSGAWFCPHGGGPGWIAALQLANPGPVASTARVITYSTGKPTAPKLVTVQPSSTVAVPIPADERAASSVVQWFGEWIAAGWIAKAEKGETGEAAEPCSPQAGSQWFAPDGDTQQGQRAFLIVMNPFAADADITVQLETSGPPFTPGRYNPFRLRPGRSTAIDLTALKKGYQAVAARVTAASGRVAVSSLGVSDTQGIRSAIGTLGTPASHTFLSGSGGTRTTIVAASTVKTSAFSASLIQSGQPQPLNGLTQANLPATSAQAFGVQAGDPSTIEVEANRASGPVAAVARVQGPGRDEGATGGSQVPANGWVITPTVAGSPSHAGLVLTNPGESPITVQLRLLSLRSASQVTVTIPATSAVGAPSAFLAKDPSAAVSATSEDGSFLATGASASGGVLGLSSYAIAQGLPIPSEWLAGAAAGSSPPGSRTVSASPSA